MSQHTVLVDDKYAEPRVRTRWAWPPWPFDFEDVVIDVTAPLGSHIEAGGYEQEIGHLVQTSARNMGRLKSLTYKRVHLARGTPWAIEFSLPDTWVQRSKIESFTPENRMLTSGHLKHSALGYIGIVAILLVLVALRKISNKRIRLALTWLHPTGLFICALAFSAMVFALSRISDLTLAVATLAAIVVLPFFRAHTA